MPCDYGGIGDRRDLQHNSFNNLYVNTSHNARKEHQIQTTRNPINIFTRKYYDNTMNQLPNGLQLNGHIYSQSFQNPVQTIQYRDFEDAGRNISIYKALYDRPVNISGELFDNKEIKLKPLIDGSKTWHNKVMGIRK